MCNASWDGTFPEVERSYQIWQPFQKRQFAWTVYCRSQTDRKLLLLTADSKLTFLLSTANSKLLRLLYLLACWYLINSSHMQSTADRKLLHPLLLIASYFFTDSKELYLLSAAKNAIYFMCYLLLIANYFICYLLLKASCFIYIISA